MKKTFLSVIKHKAIILNCLVSVLFGSIIFIFLFGIDIINPLNDSWLVENRHIDLSQGHIGWEFFRKAQWQFPLGMFNDLSYPIKTSIINTDLMPIFAVFFKIFSPVLPDTFQYYGIYGLICYMLTSLFGMLLVYKYSPKTTLGRVNSILAGVLFTLNPIISWKLYVHTPLASQWLILLSLLMIVYSEKINLKQKCVIYTLIAMFSAGIKTYFIVMTFIILIADIIYTFIRQKDKKILYTIPCYLFGTFITLYLLGFFNMNIAVIDKSYLLMLTGDHKISFASFFNNFPTFLYSDNYMYLGYGFYILFIITIISLIKKNIQKQKVISNKKEFLTLVILAIISAIIALIPNIAGILPKTVFKHLSILRFIARFMWITNYTLILLTFMYLVKFYNEKLVMLIISTCIIFQYNTCVKINSFKNSLELRYNHKLPLIKNTWDTIANKNKFETVNFSKEIMQRKSVATGTSIQTANIVIDIAHWAYKHNIKTNDYYFAKDLKDKENIYDLNYKNLDDKMLFIFLPYEPDVIQSQYPNLKYVYEVDGIILARNIPIKGLDEKSLFKFDGI